MFKYLMRFKVQNKIWLIVALALVGVFVTSAVDIARLKDSLLAEKKLKTRHLVEAAHSILGQFHELEKKGVLSEEAAKAAAMQTIRAMRYEKTEYFWINDFTSPVPKMLMHPTVPALEGKVLDADKFNKATAMQAGLDGPEQPLTGKNLFVAFNEVASQAGHGYVSYDWPKPLAAGGATSELYPKLSYVKKFEGWNWVVGSGIYIDDLDAIYWSEVQRHAIAGGVLLLVLLGFSAILARSIIEPLKITAATMHDIAEGGGDLSQRLPIMSAGVTADLAHGFNSFSAKIEHTVIQVSDATLRLAAAASQLSNVAEQTAQGVKLQQAETRGVAGAMEEMSAKVSEVAGHAANAADAARGADMEAANGKEVVSTTIASINALANEVHNAADVILKLEEGSRSIGSILEAIRGIADQTNLLALNAAIEAARAGEQGRGFAVVADEVRTLAQRTQEATAKIQSMIGNLQTDARDAARVMEEGQARADATVRQAAVAGESLEKITQAVTAITTMNQRIAEAAQEQNGVVQNIDRNITSITQVAEQNAAGAQETQSAIDELGKLMGRLQGMVKQFKTSADKA